MNELSIHGQFDSANQFFGSVETVMAIRQAIRRFGRELLCHQDMSYAQVTVDCTMQQAIQSMPREKRQAWIQWLSKLGPYWINERHHDADEWLEARNEQDVANTAIGEAAYCCVHGMDRELVSIKPSDWLNETITVKWMKNYEVPVTIYISNHCSLDTVNKTLERLPTPFSSWSTLESYAHRTCDKLTFAEEAFAALNGHSYAPGAAEQILIRLNLLNKMCGCFDDNGNRTEEGHRLYIDHFTGEKAWFSDSSDSEKRDFKSEMTLPHPARPGEYLFCTWHGKIKTPQFRIHFSWPIAADSPLYVVYVGPKITKR